MNVTEAVKRRMSIRAFKPDPVPGPVVRELLELAHRAPSGGNLQPWRVYALAGAPLAELKGIIADKKGSDPKEYDVYPPDLWDPYRSRRFQCGEDLYATIGVAREDKPGRLKQFAKNGQFFGAPVGLFFCLDRKLGPPQWSDIGMYMLTLMLLATERGLGTCAQEYWSAHNRTVTEFLGLPPELMMFCGMSLGYPDESASINTLRTRREPFDAWASMRGFD